MKLWQRTFLTLIGLAFISITILIFKDRERKKKEHFYGKITSIRYGKKAVGYITVKDKEYSLGSVRHEFSEKIRLNDSVVKKEGELYYSIFTKNGKIIKF